MYQSLIKNNYQKLSPAEKKVGDLILQGYINIYQDTIFEAAKIANVSPSLINKFCIKIGISGWKTLKGIGFVSLTQKQENDFFGKEFNILNNWIDQNSHSLEQKIKTLVNRISENKKIVIFAKGTTKMIAQIFAMKMMQLGLWVNVYDYNVDSVLLNQRSLAIFLSISGNLEKHDHHFRLLKVNNKNACFITMGEKDYDFHGLQIYLGVYNIFSKLEKTFPLVSDVFFLAFLNKIVKRFISLKTNLLK